MWLESRMKVGLGWLLAMAGFAGGTVKQREGSPWPTQMSASGAGLFHISVNGPKKQKSNVELCEQGRAEGVSTALEVLGVKKREIWDQNTEQQE